MSPAGDRTRPASHGWRLAQWLPALAVAIALAFPAIAGAEEAAPEALVPPGNSAVNQYTEAFPTARGGKDVEQTAKHARHPVRAASLGARQKHRLEAEGPDGMTAATVAEMTAPEGSDAGQRNLRKDGLRNVRNADPPEIHPADGRRGDGDRTEQGDDRDAAAPLLWDPPEGGSGLGELAGHATGFGGGGNWLLSLALLATIAWAAWFGRRRQHEAGLGGN